MAKHKALGILPPPPSFSSARISKTCGRERGRSAPSPFVPPNMGTKELRRAPGGRFFFGMFSKDTKFGALLRFALINNLAAIGTSATRWGSSPMSSAHTMP